MGHAADLADVLESRRADVVGAGRRIVVVERLDRSAHSGGLVLATALDRSDRPDDSAAPEGRSRPGDETCQTRRV
jgi:hypothetical protein